jgi:hypothetical protein
MSRSPVSPGEILGLTEPVQQLLLQGNRPEELPFAAQLGLNLEKGI